MSFIKFLVLCCVTLFILLPLAGILALVGLPIAAVLGGVALSLLAVRSACVVSCLLGLVFVAFAPRLMFGLLGALSGLALVTLMRSIIVPPPIMALLSLVRNVRGARRARAYASCPLVDSLTTA